MKKPLKLMLAAALVFTSMGGAVSAAGNNKEKGQKPPVVESKTKAWGVLENYDENGNLVDEIVIPGEGLELEEATQLNEQMELNELEVGEIGTEAYVDPGSMNYKWIDDWYGSSYVYDRLSEWTARFASVAIPLGLGAGPWTTAVSTSVFNTLYNPNDATRYYRNDIYQAQDVYWYFGKDISYEYSDSARTKLTQKYTYYYQTAK